MIDLSTLADDLWPLMAGRVQDSSRAAVSTSVVHLTDPNAAPKVAQYLVLATDPTLLSERVFTPGNGLTGTDGGAGNTYAVDVGAGAGILALSNTVAVDQAYAFTWTGAHVFSNTATFNNSTVFNGTASFYNTATFVAAALFSYTATFNGVATFNAAATFNSSIGGTYGLIPGRADWATFGVGYDGACIYNDGGLYQELMLVGNTSSGGNRVVGLWDDVRVQGYIGSRIYTSQLTGWRVTSTGAGDFRYLFVDEMHAKSFIADLEQALAGGQIISKSVAMVAQAFIAPAAGGVGTLVVRDLPSAPNMSVFQSGDIVRLRQFSRAGGGLNITDCWGVVTSYADGPSDGEQNWVFTRSSAPNAGAMATGSVIQPDAIVLDYGVSGNGYYEVNAIDGIYGANSPYAQIVVWTGHPATGSAVRGRYGKLDGWGGGYVGTNTFGLVAGDVATTWIAAEATNGFRVMYGTATLAKWDTGGNATFGSTSGSTSNVYISASGYLALRSGTIESIRFQPSYLKVDASTRLAWTFGWAGSDFSIGWDPNTNTASIAGIRGGYSYTAATVGLTASGPSTDAFPVTIALDGANSLISISNSSFNARSSLAWFNGAAAGLELGSGYPLSGAVHATNWFRSHGNTGWFSQDYGGGWFMQDTTYVRAYNDKHIYTGGGVITGTPIATHVYRTSAQAIANATWTAITFSAAITDPWNMWDDSSACYATYAGYYQVSVRGTWASNSTGVRMVAIVRNGSDYVDTQEMTAVNGSDHHMSTSFLVYLSAGDYVQMHVYQSSGGALDIGSSSNTAFYCRMGLARIA